MNPDLPLPDAGPLASEHGVLLRAYGQVQLRCSEMLRAQADTIERLEAQQMRLRAAVMLRDTALAWLAEDRARQEAAVPGLPRRRTLARRVEALLARVRELLGERVHLQLRTRLPEPEAVLAGKPTDAPSEAAPPDDLRALEASLVAADLVICQTGCLSHGAYWRVQDHCKRTGKACVFVAQPQDVRIVRIARPTPDDQP